MYRQLSWFFVVGGTTWCVYMASLALGEKIFLWPSWLTISFAYVVTVVFHFIANRTITFPQHTGSLSRQLSRQAVVVVANYIITLLLNLLLISKLDWNMYLSASLVVVLTSAFNFTTNKYWIFSAK